MESRRSKEEMFTLVEQWEASKESQKSFCEPHGIRPATFSYWVTKYRQEKSQSVASDFIKLLPSQHQTLEVIYPNGVIIRVPAESSLADLRMLIQLV